MQNPLLPQTLGSISQGLINFILNYMSAYCTQGKHKPNCHWNIFYKKLKAHSSETIFHILSVSVYCIVLPDLRCKLLKIHCVCVCVRACVRAWIDCACVKHTLEPYRENWICAIFKVFCFLFLKVYFKKQYFTYHCFYIVYKVSVTVVHNILICSYE